MKKSALGIITARGGSKGVPDKNIRPINGKPVIAYTIDAAKACGCIDTVMVTTDSKKIQETAQRCGAEAPFLRPAELATDTAKQEDAILHAMDYYEKQGRVFDYVVLLEPTTPLRRAETLREGFKLLESRPDADAVFSITECDISPVFCSTLRADHLMKDWMDERFKWLNRQEIPAYYQPSPLVTISKWKSFKEKKTFMHDSTLAMIVDPVEAKDIDTPLHFFILESLVKYGFAHSDDLLRHIKEKST